MAGQPKDLTGQKFGRLTAKKPYGKDKQNNIIWECFCGCGNPNPVYVITTKLTCGRKCSCGCLIEEEMKNRSISKYNKYDLISYEYGVGWTTNTNKEFYFDLEDYDKIKDYAWHETQYGYIKTTVHHGEKIFLHKLITNTDSQTVIDHKNRCKNDCRKNNLRIATRSQNSINQNLRKNNTSGCTGVMFDKSTQMWKARITINKKCLQLGSFINKQDAIRARLNAESKYLGEFAPQKHLFEEYGIK